MRRSLYRGIDVSQWQGEINWDKVKESGIDFAIIRTGFGRNESNQEDYYFKQNILCFDGLRLMQKPF